MGRTVLLATGTSVVGRSPQAAIMLDDGELSRRHAEFLTQEDGQVTVRDLSSTNGSEVNDEYLDTTPRPLRDGDLVRLGRTVVLHFCYQHADEQEKQEQAYNTAVRDPLTGVYNRRYFMDRLQQEFTWAAQQRRPLSLALLDLDHFKNINDTYGHDVGDQVLVAVAQSLEARIQRDEVLARLGGEEFVLLLRDTNRQAAVAFAEQVRLQVAKVRVPHPLGEISVTTSLGVSISVLGDAKDSHEKLMLRADNELYRAKRGGRNQVSAQEPSAGR